MRGLIMKYVYFYYTTDGDKMTIYAQDKYDIPQGKSVADLTIKGNETRKQLDDLANEVLTELGYIKKDFF